MELRRHIEILLLENDCVIVPNLGGFMAHHVEARYDKTDGIGYLRVDTPTGEKVNMSRNNPATYDFSENMRPWNAGLEVCFDLKVMKHLNAFGSLDWGLSNTMDPDSDAVAFKMYPIYATFGVAYRY